jgi:uncharacterized protein YceH (UPF0502 family)
MSISLDSLEQRIIGALIEKQYTVPDTYPLTLQALVAACNQKNNRDPQLTVEDYEVEGALRALMDRDWIVRLEREGSRAMRYAHQAKEQLGVEKHELALLSELLCRGPQAPGALKTRAGRMAHVPGAGEVAARLAAMAARPIPYVQELPKRPREQACRWRHCLGPMHADHAGDGDETVEAGRAGTPATRWGAEAHVAPGAPSSGPSAPAEPRWAERPEARLKSTFSGKPNTIEAARSSTKSKPCLRNTRSSTTRR